MYKNRKMLAHKNLPLKMKQNREKREIDSDRFKRLTIPPNFLSLNNTTLDYSKLKDKKIKCTPFIQQFRNSTPEIADESQCLSLGTGVDDLDYTKSSSSNNSHYIDTKPKSLFKEINEKYELLILNSQRETSPINTTNCTNIQSSHSFGDDIIVEQPPVHNSFSRNLSKRIQVRFKRDSFAECIKSVRKHIQEIDNAISGEKKQEKKSMDLNEMDFSKINDLQDDELMELVPPSLWEYETPTKQKILTPQLAESSIKTALIQPAKDRQKSSLYEVKTNKLSLNRHNPHKNIGIDLKYLANEVNVSKFTDHGIENCASSSCFPEMKCDVLNEDDKSEKTVFQPIIDQPKKKFKSLKRCRSDSLERLKKSHIFEDSTNQIASRSEDFYLNNVTFAPLNYDDADKENKLPFSFETPTKRKMFNFNNSSKKLFDFSNLN